jgi:hypothetical protein
MKYARRSSLRSLRLALPQLGALGAFALLAACTSGGGNGGTSLSSLVYDKSAPNKASFFVGDASGLTGVYQDTDNLTRMLSGTDWNFQVETNGPGAGDDDTPQTSQQIEAQFIKSSVELRDASLSATMFFYFTGHGSDDGSLITPDGGFHFSELARKVKQQRGKAFKRLVVLVDSCFSGQIATGSDRVTAAGLTGGLELTPGSIDVPTPPDANVTSDKVARSRLIATAIANDVVSVGNGLADELIVVTASAPEETSGDESNGGTGTLAFIRALEGANETTTIEAFYQTMRSNAFGQTPQLSTEPQELRQQPIKGADSRGSGGGSRGVVPAQTGVPTGTGSSGLPPASTSTGSDDGSFWE